MKQEADLIVARAETRAAAARAAVLSTLAEIRHRLSPKTVATGIAERAADRAGALAQSAGDTVKARPVASSAGALAVAGIVALGVWLKGRGESEET